MSITYTNEHGIPLALAAWLLHDEYDYVQDPRYFSVTTLMKPVRQIILAARAKAVQRTKDLSECIASSLGSAYHTGVENAWTNGNHVKPLRAMGYSEEEINSILINPTDDQLAENPDAPTIYVEQRTIRTVGDYRIGGKFDIVMFGEVQDNKSTSVYTYLLGGKDDDYILQGSLYRWLNPKKINASTIQINFLFTDWKKADSLSRPDYPKTRIATKSYQLIPIVEVEVWVRNKLNEISRYWDAPEEEIPHCTDSDLWLSDPQFRYYADSTITDPSVRSTKNFTSLAEATQYQREKGKGVVLPAPRIAKRCSFCDGFPLCTQKDSLNHDRP